MALQLQPRATDLTLRDHLLQGAADRLEYAMLNPVPYVRGSQGKLVP